jgi:hypothetical protein
LLIGGLFPELRNDQENDQSDDRRKSRRGKQADTEKIPAVYAILGACRAEKGGSSLSAGNTPAPKKRSTPGPVFKFLAVKKARGSHAGSLHQPS